jgi:tRNA G18 (ribose-2'-O)-methylase SpoU
MSSGEQIRGLELFLRQQSNKNKNGPVVICDGIQTPENFGSILRVADATGCQNIWLLDSDLDLKSKKLSKLARSADQHLDIEHLTLESFIEKRPLFKQLCALEITTQSSNLFETDISSCDGIVVGHESLGIRAELLNYCDSAIHLPMYGTNGSMNVSHALSVCLYEWRRQQ